MSKTCVHACFEEKCIHNNMFIQQNVVMGSDLKYNEKVVQIAQTGEMISECFRCCIRKSQPYIEIY